MNSEHRVVRTFMRRYAADAGLLKEAGEPCRRRGHVHGLLQLLLAAPAAEQKWTQAGHAGKAAGVVKQLWTVENLFAEVMAGAEYQA